MQPDYEFHGSKGPLLSSLPTEYMALHLPFVQAMNELGVPTNHEPVRNIRMSKDYAYLATERR